MSTTGKQRLGELVIDAHTSLIQKAESTDPRILESRILGRIIGDNGGEQRRKGGQSVLSWVRDSIILDDCEHALPDLPASSVGLVFTSPPYFNARPEYELYV